MISEQNQTLDNTINFAERMLSSQSFSQVFAEGMAMVEEAAAYLDGEGREDARQLSHTAALLFSSEAMCLTTRLMQLASWLLLQRAARSGEMSAQQIAAEKARVHLDTPSAGSTASGWRELPLQFIDLIERSLRLQLRIQRLGQQAEQEGAMPRRTIQRNAVQDQVVQLRQAFNAC